VTVSLIVVNVLTQMLKQWSGGGSRCRRDGARGARGGAFLGFLTVRGFDPDIERRAAVEG
jgi:hypothetical protein